MYALVLVTFVFWSGDASPNKMLSGPNTTIVGKFGDQSSCRQALSGFDPAQDWVVKGKGTNQDLVVVNLMCLSTGS